MIKIAFIVNDLNLGGIQKSLINILNKLDYSKYDLDVYSFNEDIFYKKELNSKANLIILNNYHSIFKFIPFKIACHICRNKNNISKLYDYVIDFDSYQFNTAYTAINIKGNNKIMWIHNDVKNEIKYNLKYRILHFFMKGKYKFFKKYVGVSDGVIAPFKEVNKISNASFKVIPNFIDTSEIFKKLEDSPNIKIDENKYNLISIGRLCHQKGYDILINYLKELTFLRKDFHCYLVGDGDEKNNLIKQINKLNLENYITLLGKDNNPFKYAKLMDGFVLTSRYEGQGMAILEAKAIGLDIFISKNIEKYNGYNIKGTSDIVTSLAKATKKNHQLDDLKEYNDNILNSLNILFKNN